MSYTPQAVRAFIALVGHGGQLSVAHRVFSLNRSYRHSVLHFKASIRSITSIMKGGELLYLFEDAVVPLVRGWYLDCGGRIHRSEDVNFWPNLSFPLARCNACKGKVVGSLHCMEAVPCSAIFHLH